MGGERPKGCEEWSLCGWKEYVRKVVTQKCNAKSKWTVTLTNQSRMSLSALLNVNQNRNDDMPTLEIDEEELKARSAEVQEFVTKSILRNFSKFSAMLQK